MFVSVAPLVLLVAPRVFRVPLVFRAPLVFRVPLVFRAPRVFLGRAAPWAGARPRAVRAELLMCGWACRLNVWPGFA